MKYIRLAVLALCSAACAVITGYGVFHHLYFFAMLSGLMTIFCQFLVYILARIDS